MLTQTVRLFLDSFGRSEEYEFYIKKFQSDRSDCFAMLCMDEDTCDTSLESLELSLQYLLKLELYPAIILTGPAARRMSLQLQSLKIALRVLRQDVRGNQNRTLHNIRQFLKATRQENALPVIVIQDELLLSALEILTGVIANRVHFIRSRGALKNTADQDLLYFRLKENIETVHPEDRHLLDMGLKLVRRNRKLHLSVTAPYNLLKEIFTVKGAGTMIRPGSVINYHTSAESIDRDRLRALLRESFKRDLVREDFIDAAAHVYIEENYEGAILLEQHTAGVYLSKFAVGARARGIGIAQELWDRVLVEHPAIFWRSRGNNSVNLWYARIADGQQRMSPWNIFWRGVAIEHIPEIVNFCVNRPEDFVPRRVE